MKKTSASMISGAMDAEAALARESADKALDSMPDGPEKEAAKAQREILGDLSDLPPGHPVRMAMEEARLRYEAEQELLEQQTEEEKEAEIAKVKRAKRLDKKKAERAARDREEEKIERRRAAAKNVNASMTEAMDSLKRLDDNIVASSEDFAGDRYTQMKLERLHRVLIATMRGISESKVNPGRLTNG